jgi:hypothetical protein
MRVFGSRERKFSDFGERVDHYDHIRTLVRLLPLASGRLVVNGKRCREVYVQMVERAIHSRFLVGRSLGQNQMPALASVAAF